jgi:ribosomal protein S12 methylthiotransferase
VRRLSKYAAGSDLSVGFEVVELGPELGQQTGSRRKVFLDASDVRVRRVVRHFVVDVDLVHDRGAELGLVFGDEQDSGCIARLPRPLDHHRHARGLEPAPQHLGLDPRPLAELDQTAVVGVFEGRRIGYERDSAVGALRSVGAVFGAARGAPQSRFVGHGGSVRAAGRYDTGVSARRIPEASFPVSAPATSTQPTNTPSTSFYVETLGCPKNAVDSDKVVASLLADGLVATADASQADLVVVNTCAFIEAARQESIDVALSLADAKRPGAKLVVTGCMAERYGEELAAALPEADAVIGFAGEGAIAEVVMLSPRRKPVGVRDLLELPRPAPTAPWAYVKVAEGCDRACAFCAIPSFRGKQRSRTAESIETEVRGLVEAGVSEIVLVAQDLAWYGRDIGEPGSLAPLLRRLDKLSAIGLARVRLLYLYPSEVHDPLVSTMLELATVVPYFDLSLQHAAPELLRGMKRWGNGDRFRAIIDGIRTQEPDAVFRSSFIVGFPGETESDHDDLLRFLADARLDWAGFFSFSSEDGTAAATMDGMVADDLVRERLRECAEVQDPITTAARLALVGEKVEVLIDGTDDDGSLVGRTFREAPEIDGIIRLVASEGDAALFARPGAIVTAAVTGIAGPDLEATPIELVQEVSA